MFLKDTPPYGILSVTRQKLQNILPGKYESFRCKSVNKFFTSEFCGGFSMSVYAHKSVYPFIWFLYSEPIWTKFGIISEDFPPEDSDTWYNVKHTWDPNAKFNYLASGFKFQTKFSRSSVFSNDKFRINLIVFRWTVTSNILQSNNLFWTDLLIVVRYSVIKNGLPRCSLLRLQGLVVTVNRGQRCHDPTTTNRANVKDVV